MNYIIPTLNRSSLKRAVNSILKNDTNANIIINSSENSASSNRNEALKRIDIGLKWIIFLDDDDYLSDGYLSELDCDADIVVFRMDQGGRIIPHPQRNELVGGNVGINFAITTEFYQKLQLEFDDLGHGEDFRFLQKYLELNPKVKITDQTYYNAPTSAHLNNERENENISVIIPTYNSPEALKLCITSLLEGQENNNEIIVVVDGTEKENEKVLEEFHDKIETLILNDNCGVAHATNVGVYNATNDKVLVINDDNVASVGWDKHLLDAYKPNTVVTPNQIEPYQSMYDQFHIYVLARAVKELSLERFIEYERSISENKIDYSGGTLPFLISKIDYLKVGGWDTNYKSGLVADYDFFLKCQLCGMDLIRTYATHFYHFVSLSVTDDYKRRIALRQAHDYGKYKWGGYIINSRPNNKKSIQK